MTTAADVLNVARSYLGVTEDPPHSNQTIIGEKFGWNGVAWCAESVTVWQHEAGNSAFDGSASCSVLVGRYQDGTNGTWGVDPDSGDEGFLGSNGGDHTFIVEQNTGDGWITTIEGNWGDKVCRVRRSINSVHGFGRPNYDGAGQPTPPPSQTGGRPVLRQGSKGQSVTEWQKLMAGFAPPCGVDGDFGPETVAATKKFQTDQHMTADGEVGPETYAAMDRVLAWCAAQGQAPAPDPGVPAFPGETQRGSTGDAVRQVQQRLKDRGWKVTVDGDFGAKTESAVRKYQSEKGLAVDGVVGPDTWNSLWTTPTT